MFIKIGEYIELSVNAVQDASTVIPMMDKDILEKFQKFASNLKKIAPKADDFLYFSAVMMHAAESSAINDDGTPKLNARGEIIQVGWDNSNDSWRWQTNDPSIRPFKNNNGDIFPENQLIKAHKKWIGKPLCVDHKSSSVDHTRGFIVDTYYDRHLKRVIALCALDKANYPDLARKVATKMQTSVSMGVGVGRAICTDCARVARTEADFCDHMRHKTSYGEINIDLNPIELSIVVNGADPKAHIKHIIAAANNMNTYLENKQKELEKLASNNFQANLTFEIKPEGNLSTDPGKITNISISSKDINDFRSDIEKAIEEYKNLQNSLLPEEKESQNSDDKVLLETPSADSGLSPPHARFAQDEISNIKQAIETKFHSLKESLDKLSNRLQKTQEEHMSDANINKQGYFQGGGGVNEPTPGQPKYSKDPLNEKLRDHEDKQMVGQDGFPGVGPVDGMHDSPDSADVKNELERKKMLARAQSEERALRRQAIVNLAKKALEDKKAYFQNGLEKNNVNTPAPHQVKYQIDKLNEQLRDHEDKQMVGQKPFPNVGPVDGMHPSPNSADVSDELKRKEMLRRASLRARFVKANNNDGSQNLGKSAWEVFMGDKLLLTASVDDLSGGFADSLYDKIATKEFAVKLIEKVKKEGADKVLSLLKKAQVAPPPAETPAVAEAPVDVPADVSVEDKGGSGDPKENLLEMAEKARDLTSDMVEGVRALTGEQAEMGNTGDLDKDMGVTASALRKELNSDLCNALRETIAGLNEHQDELRMIADLYTKGAVNASNKDFVGTIADDAANEAKLAIANGFNLMAAFVKYAKATDAITKRAQIETELRALADDNKEKDMDNDYGCSDHDLMNLINSNDKDLEEVNHLLADDNDHMDKEPHSELLEELGLEKTDHNDAMLTVKPGEQVPTNLPKDTKVELAAPASYDSREGRNLLRAKLAADATGKEDSGEVQDMSKAKFSDMLEEANRLTDGQTQLDVKPSDNLGRFETLPEQNKAMMELAKAPPRVRKEAEAIHSLVVSGKLDPKDFDALIAEGLDKDAVAYWKKFYGQVDGGNEFASELVKEHTKAQLEEQLNVFRVKLARAYELAYDMVARGLCYNDRAAISTEVDRIMKFNDESFESFKRVVSRHEPLLVKEAGRIPQVGLLNVSNGDERTSTDDSLYSQLTTALSTTSKKMF